FYAGMPLVTPGGAAIGTVCVIDQQPRELDPVQREALAALARLTMTLLEGRQRERELERAALLATVSAAESTAVQTPVSNRCTVLIMEVQDFLGAVLSRGERTLDKLLTRLEQTLESHLRPQRGDNLSRVSGGAEIIAVLHGDDVAAPLGALREAVAAFERDSGLRLLTADADSGSEGLPAPKVFLRADEALSRLRDELAASALAA
ncbi:MAG: GAF domain-containing protein, partial [Xanthomonadales bacterium]|nr:GAF domain-containing protein [Xanthomonadales bacterium]